MVLEREGLIKSDTKATNSGRWVITELPTVREMELGSFLSCWKVPKRINSVLESFKESLLLKSRALMSARVIEDGRE